ncbi:MAG: DinB family protein [Bacteroidota bacterium]
MTNTQLNYLVAQLDRHKDQFEVLFSQVEEEHIRWKVAPEKWCPLEIVCHLYDEERLDFRTRTKLLLKDPDSKLPPFNPLEWVTAHRYMEQSYEGMLKLFLEERDKSIEWLRSLDETAPWQHEQPHPRLGKLTPSFFLTNWVAHDLLHLRQLIRWRYDLTQQYLQMDVSYAGNWV